VELLAAEIPPWAVALIAFLFGAAWGSFFNVAIYRWPLGLSVVRPASHCPSCRAIIPAYLNVPIFGYLFLRGKTACCGQPLSPRYPIVEALSAVLCVALAQRYIVAAPEGTLLSHGALTTLCYFIFAGGLLIATFVDLERMEIPDEVSLPGAALGLATAVWRDPPGAADAALGAGAGFLVVQVLFVWCYELVLGRRGMGEGDSKLLLMIGAFVGWQGAAFALFAGAAQGLLAAVVGLVLGRMQPETPAPPSAKDSADAAHAEPAPIDAPDLAEDGEADDFDDPPPRWIGHHKLPFGPFLALGALEYLFFGERLIELWMRFAS
jgi:leader peptidase (prepilin peptidase)/N-methyltransferase